MAVIRLQLDIDSDVYPELYERLQSIDRLESRQERLRQLAASGLVWEAVRMQGPAVTAGPLGVTPARKPLARTLGPGAAANGTPAAAQRDTDRADLAMGAPPPATEGVPHAGGRHGPPEPQSIPVLLDVVDETAAPVPLEGPRTTPTAAQLPLRDGAGDASANDRFPLPPPLDAGVYRPSARSARLKRMVDRGLFKNG